MIDGGMPAHQHMTLILISSTYTGLYNLSVFHLIDIESINSDVSACTVGVDVRSINYDLKRLHIVFVAAFIS